MAAMTPLTITLFARVGESGVLNEIGTVALEATTRGMTDEEREHAAPEAIAVVDIDIAKMLRDAADEYEREHAPEPEPATPASMGGTFRMGDTVTGGVNIVIDGPPPAAGASAIVQDAVSRRNADLAGR